MRIVKIHTQADYVLFIVADDGRTGFFDVSHYLEYEAFQSLRDPGEFTKVFNHPQ